MGKLGVGVGVGRGQTPEAYTLTQHSGRPSLADCAGLIVVSMSSGVCSEVGMCVYSECYNKPL